MLPNQDITAAFLVEPTIVLVGIIPTVVHTKQQPLTLNPLSSTRHLKRDGQSEEGSEPTNSAITHVKFGFRTTFNC
eukprot:1117429-Amphidinium_carterae.1